jgi:hypothetical protein
MVRRREAPNPFEGLWKGLQSRLKSDSIEAVPILPET